MGLSRDADTTEIVYAINGLSKTVEVLTAKMDAAIEHRQHTIAALEARLVQAETELRFVKWFGRGGRVRNHRIDSRTDSGGAMRFLELLFERLRINVVIVALVIAFLVHDFGDKLIGLLRRWWDTAGVDNHPAINADRRLNIGGLIAAMIQMFNSPQVPADSHERIVKALMDRIEGQHE